MRYPAQFKRLKEGGYLITFRDIPEAITQSESLEEGVILAQDALRTAMEFYFEDQRAVPLPSPCKSNEDLVTLPASIWAKVLLLNSMIDGQIRQVDLARLMNIKPQQVTRLVNLDHPTKIDEIQRAIECTGRRLNFCLI